MNTQQWAPPDEELVTTNKIVERIKRLQNHMCGEWQSMGQLDAEDKDCSKQAERAEALYARIDSLLNRLEVRKP